MENEQLMQKALEMLDQGRPRQEIKKAFPDSQKEIQSFFDTLDMINSQTRDIAADPDLLSKILAQINIGQSRSPAPEIKGRVNILEQLINVLEPIMEIKWAFVLPIILIAFAAIFFFTNKQNLPIVLEQPSPTPAQEAAQDKTQEQIAEPTGDPDQLIEELTMNLLEEQAIFDNEIADSESLMFDANAINNIQLYDENEI